MRLKDRVAIVTGGASGIGRATVELFLQQGASVVAGDLNSAAGARLLDELGGEPRTRLRFVEVDIADEAAIQRMVASAVKDFGRLDVMFNNAGLGGAFGPITEIDVEHWDYTLGVLLRGAFLGIKHAARQMIRQGEGGVILNTGSVAGLSGGGGPQAYSAAKAAVINLSQTTAVELARYRIRVNTISPGVIFTPLMHGGNEADAEQVMSHLQPWPKRGEAADIAAVALFLASDEGQFITGQNLVVDGGLTAAGTRIFGNLRGTRDLESISGVTHGTTGRAAEVHRSRDDSE